MCSIKNTFLLNHPQSSIVLEHKEIQIKRADIAI